MTLPLRVRDLRVQSRTGRDLLHVPALDVPAGGVIGIRGPSGAGKTTLLHAISGVVAAKGQIIWGQKDIAALGAEARTRFRNAQIGMIFQDFLLLDEVSALGNAALASLFAPRASRAGMRQRANEQLRALGLSQPHRKTTSYSRGEKQRVAVARALAGDRAILLADEPTASLDRHAADQLIRDVLDLVRGTGKTLIVVSHDAHFLGAVDRVVTLKDGHLQQEPSV